MFYTQTPTISGSTLTFTVTPQPGDVIQFVCPMTNTSFASYNATFSDGVISPLLYGGEESFQSYFFYLNETYLAVFTGSGLEVTAQQAADNQGNTVNTEPFVVNTFLDPAYSGLLATQMADLQESINYSASGVLSTDNTWTGSNTFQGVTTGPAATTSAGFTTLSQVTSAVSAASGDLLTADNTWTGANSFQGVTTGLAATTNDGFTTLYQVTSAVSAASGDLLTANNTWNGSNSFLGQTTGVAATTSAGFTTLEQVTSREYGYLPLGSVPLTASLTQTTASGQIVQDNLPYTVPTYTQTYAASSDTYEFVNSSGGMTSVVVANGAATPATPAGYVPFQKVSTTFLATPAEVSGIVGTAGTLASGSYTYQVVQLNNSGASLPSPALTLTIGSSGSAELGWRLVPYATSSSIYRDGYFLTTVTGQTYTDTGAATTTAAVPTTNTSNFVYVSVPLYQVINTNKEKDINLGLFGPALNSDVTALLLGILEYGSSIYQSGQYYTQYAQQPANLINAVRVVIPDGQYKVSQTVTVPPGITLDFDGLILSNVLDLYSPCFIWGIGSFSNEIQIEANNGSGVQLGQLSTQNNIHFGNIRIANVGGTYNAPMNLGQQGLTLLGYNITIGTAQVFLGSIGLVLHQASDVRIGRILVVGSYQGIELIYSEHVGIDFIDIDTPTGLAGYIDSCHDVTLNGTMWINGGTYGGTANTRPFLNIGSQSSGNIVAGLRCNLNLLNCGDIPIAVANIDQSLMDVVVGPGNLYTGVQYPPQSVISYGAGVSPGFTIRGTAVIPTTTNWDNGTTPSGGYSLFVNGVLESS